ncbi:hypothetical protein AYJ54_24270 [Bradyrhizobium centrolobii]|uniref:Uncharacterized protein n=1 Tax=Bradyrhizobium centrolobii TaxID=1505087 RepID=A0A176YFU5_9BRAD|nr:hypothetical protein [Bradyrhizobium centrolobii]OAF04307.1 hypothetical protein AYJ54_24270 [Bradyrhizobium centrolobii]
MYDGRREITARLSWAALVELASPSVPDNLRQELEQRILAGKRVGAPEIRHARGRLRNGRQRRKSEALLVAASLHRPLRVVIRRRGATKRGI